MKTLSFLAAIAILTIGQSADARSYRTQSSDVYVNGYTKSNGTYVQPHYRSSPDSIKSNNYGCLDNGRC
jgi:hypothetical protein